MEKVTVWYLTDNDHGSKLVETIRNLGISLNEIYGYDLKQANIIEDEINIYIYDVINKSPNFVIEMILQDQRLQSSVKYIILTKKQIGEIQAKSYNILHLEFVSRPVYKREFLLLLEKTIIVERYREIMKFVSREAENRIETYEALMDINRSNVFDSESEKAAFERILSYEKNLLNEQNQLNKAIKDFTLMRQSEMFDLRKRIHAEEMLGDLRRKELLDANDVIGAQESVINYSAKELDEAKKIFNASEQVAELSRSESIQIRDDLKHQKELNKRLSMEVEELLKEIESLKKKK